jgi:PAS domain S-box-containing protein
LKKKIITSGLALAVLTLIGSITQASSTSVIYFFCSSLSLVLFVLVYHLLNRQISERQLVEANFQDLYNNAPCGYHTIDQDGTFIAINNTELSWLGYSRDEVIGKLKLSDLLLPESLATFQENFESIRSGGGVKDLEFQMIRKDGTILPVLSNSTAIKDEAGMSSRLAQPSLISLKRKQAEENAALDARLSNQNPGVYTSTDLHHYGWAGSLPFGQPCLGRIYRYASGGGHRSLP